MNEKRVSVALYVWEYGHKLRPVLVVKDNKWLENEPALTEYLFQAEEFIDDRLIAFTWMVFEDTN